jgi:hypothetical protein
MPPAISSSKLGGSGGGAFDKLALAGRSEARPCALKIETEVP